MFHHRRMHIINVITTYLVIFSLLASPVASRRGVIAAPPQGTAGQASSPTLTLTKSDSMIIDQDGDGRVEPGDTLRYTLTAKNTGTVDASGVVLKDVLSEYMSLVPGSLKSTPLAYGQTVTLPEDSGPIPVMLSGVDFDGDLLDYQVTSGPAHGATGGTAPNLTYQPTTPHYFGPDSFTFQVCDSASPANCDSATVNLVITPVNDAPSFTASGETLTVWEDSAPYSQVGWAKNLSAGPANEIGQTLSFVVSNDNNSLFAVQPAVSADGTLTFTLAPDRYGQAEVTVRLQDNGGTDSGGEDTSAPQSFTIVVSPVNDAPAFLVGPNQTIFEDAGLQTVENWATGITPGPYESSQSVMFEITGNTNPTLFAVSPAVSPQGTLTYQPAPNQVGTAEIRLRLKDDGGTENSGVDSSLEQSFLITVQEYNDPPQVEGATFSVQENSPQGTQVGTVTFTDPDPGQTHVFGIIAGDDAGVFAIHPTSGVITVADPAELDFETTPTFNLTVSVTDNGIPAETGTATVTIQVEDANDAPVVKPATFSLAENSPNGTTVGTIDVSDQDPGQSFTLSITAGNTGGAFAINADREITVADATAIDFETHPTFRLTIRAEDDGTPAMSGSGEIIVNLSDVNEAPVIQDGTYSLEEFSPEGTVVGVVNLTDPDAAQTHTFEITAGNTGDTFAIDNTGKITVANSTVLDYSKYTSFILTVKATDSGSPALSATGTVTVTLTNVNDIPVVTPATFAVNENSPAGTVVGDVDFTDKDHGQTYTFSISDGNEGGAFTIDPTTGVITVASPEALDFETRKTFSLQVTVTDNGVPPAAGSAIITVNVNDVNEAPVVSNSTFSLPENSAIATSLGKVSFTDPDAGQSHTFAITAGNEIGAFTIHPTTGEITVANQAALNYEAHPTFILTVEVKDDGEPIKSATATITINLSDVNEAPVINDAVFSIDENSPVGFQVGTLPVSDPDTGQSHTFQIASGNNGGAFAIDNNGRITVAVSAAVDFETNPTFTLNVKVTDSGSPALVDTAVVTINLKDVNEAPIVAGERYDTVGNTLLQVAAAATAAEPRIFVQGNLLANDSDPDVGDKAKLEAYLVEASAGAVVNLSPSGEFTYLPPANVTSDSFTYRVVDPGGLETTGVVTITMVGRVWYVKNNAPPNGLGRSSDPFDTLAEAQSASSAGDTIYVYYGDGTTTNQNAGITLKNNQRLLGAGVALELPVSVNGAASSTRLLDADRQPRIENASGVGVTFSNAVAEVRGLNITGSSKAIGVTIRGAGAGTMVIRDNTLTANGAEGIYLDLNSTGTVGAVVRDNSITAAGSGFDLVLAGTSGGAQVDFSDNTITAAGYGVSMKKTGGTLTVTGFANNVISGEKSGKGAVITGAVFDAVPGGALNPLAPGSFSAGTAAKPVSTEGLSITSAQGDLSFSALSVYANGSALQLSGTGAGLKVAVDDGKGSLTADGGPALSLASLQFNAPNLALTSTNSPTNGVSLTSVSGSLSTTSNSAISGSTAYAFNMTDSSATVVFNGSINNSGKGINLKTNTAGSVTFAGGLTLNTAQNPAFTVDNSGTLTVLGTTNTIVTTSGTALSVKNTTIGSGGLTFRSISANGASVGVELVNTGSKGGLTVSGTGAAGTGGTIQNISDDGVRLHNTQKVSLSFMNITNAASSTSGFPCGNLDASGCTAAVDMKNASDVTLTSINVATSKQIGINGYQVNGLVMKNVIVTNAGDTNDEYALLLHDPSGTYLVEDSTFTGMYEGGIRLYKTNANVLNMTLRRVTVSSNSVTGGEDGFQFDLVGNSVANILVDNSTFTQLQRDGIDGAFQERATLHLTVQNSRFENNFSGIILGGNDNAKGFLTLNGNTIKNTVSTAITLTTAVSAVLDAKVTGNTIEHPAPPSAQVGEGIHLSQEEASTMIVLLDGNKIGGTGSRGISGYARLPFTAVTGSLHVTATNNTVGMPLTDLANGMDFSSQDSNHTICLDIQNNTAAGKNTAGIRVRNTAGDFQLEGASLPAAPTITQVADFINSRNTSSPAASASAATGKSFTGVAVNKCWDANGADLPPTVMSQPAPLLAQSAGRGMGLAQLVREAPRAQLASETVQVDIGTLPAEKSVTITFDVVVADTLPDGLLQLSNQASLSGDNFTTLKSDDPATEDQTGDPTITQLYRIPTAVDDEYVVDEDGTLTVPAPGVLSNDLAAAGYTLSAVLDSGPAAGVLTLAGDGGFTYTPPADVTGDQTFIYHASDGEESSNAAVVTVRVRPVNDAPVLDPTGQMKLAGVGVGETENPGTRIIDLLASAGDRIADVDANPLEGIAVTAVNSAYGSWQFTTDGLTWQDLGTPGEAAARLLAADEVTRLRFVPAGVFYGVIDPAIHFRAWDQTSGVNGSTADTRTSGGTTAFSTAVATASIEVYPMSDLVLNMSASESTVIAGNQLTYTLLARNNGPNAGQQIKITDTLPAGLSFVSASSGCVEAGGTVTCQKDSLDLNELASFDITVEVATNLTGAVTNTAVLSSSIADPDGANNITSQTVTAQAYQPVIDPTKPPDPTLWNTPIITQPRCGSTFLGEYGNETVTLSLDNLPKHTQVTVEFDLLILRSWDGNQQVNASAVPDAVKRLQAMGISVVGPDQWSFSMDNQTVLNTTFSNWDPLGFRQAYPGQYPGGDYPARTGAAAINSLCYTFGSYQQDSIYHMRFSLPHSADTLKLDFAAQGLQGIEDESWGLDNVSVKVSSGADLMPNRLYFPVIGR